MSPSTGSANWFEPAALPMPGEADGRKFEKATEQRAELGASMSVVVPRTRTLRSVARPPASPQSTPDGPLDAHTVRLRSATSPLLETGSAA